ncbi:hypothetical protein [Cellulomonas sp. PhB143]|uniref:hypothetical protein n=1 Tax=Cellulomonas sp. PhB143 TaxID=2485186 RepID=UPI000F4A3359|nr:hypothetical protein [Cellulomonas sp. PhB143]ROS74588.1 hypothetical protein EDF32_2335 [Cellulomonas sp. PhB143]
MSMTQTAETVLMLALAVVLVLGWLLWVSASRLDRLHRKVVASRIALDGQLVRRASAAADLASAGVLDPASSMLVAESAAAVVLDDDLGDRELALAVPDLAAFLHERSAAGARVADGPGPAPTVRDRLAQGFDAERATAESELSATLREALGGPDEVRELCADPHADALVRALGAAWFRVQLARRFHNEAVLRAQHVRRQWYVRLFRVAGHAAMPVTVELDDAWPDGLGAASGVGPQA